VCTCVLIKKIFIHTVSTYKNLISVFLNSAKKQLKAEHKQILYLSPEVAADSVITPFILLARALR